MELFPLFGSAYAVYQYTVLRAGVFVCMKYKGLSRGDWLHGYSYSL